MIALLPHTGFLSETSRMLAIGRALRARGERVVFASHGGPYLQVLEQAGETCHLLEPLMDRARCERYVRDIIQIGRPGLRMQPADEVRAGVASEVRFFREHGVRLAVVGFTLTAHLSTRVVGIPLAASHGGSYVPPVLERGLAPVPTQMHIPGIEWLPRRVKHWLANNRVERMPGPVRFLNEIAAELGVEPVPSLAALLIADLTLVTDLPEVLGVPRAELEAWRPSNSRHPAGYRPGTRLVYTGPLFAQLDLPVPDAVQAFLDGSRPTAYVALTSSTPQQLRAVVARTRAAGLRVIVGATIHDFGPVSDPDIVVAGLLPSHRIMPSVDVAVTMGGQGSVQTAMTSGTLLVAIPLQPEQELNVALAVRQGMARGVAPRHAGTERLTEALQDLLRDPEARSSAARVRAIYGAVDGAATAAQAIAGYLHAPNGSHRPNGRTAIQTNSTDKIIARPATPTPQATARRNGMPAR
jgi:UDP:flavonoid glycosyltransferase YjiC (YdhE family)